MPLSERLKLETLRRIQSGVLGQMVVILFTYLVFANDPGQSAFFKFGLLFNLSLLGFRGTLFWFYHRNVPLLLDLYKYFMASSLTAALFYGLLGYDAIHTFREMNSQAIVLLYLTAGMMTAALSSLAPSINYQRLYFALCATPIFVACLNPRIGSSFHHIAAIYAVFLVYLFTTARGINRDLVGAYRSEIETRLQKETLQKVIDLVPGFVALSDSTGNWVTTSRSFEKYKTSTAFLEIFNQFRLGQVNQSTREIQWYENGEAQSYILSTQKYPDLSMIILGVPAEEIFEMRRQLDARRMNAEFSSRLATLGEMAGGIAHEVNNPLAVIVGICSQITMMAKQVEPDLPKIVEKIEKISKTSFRISKIIQGLRAFSRQSDQDAFVETNLNQLLEDTLELCREKFYQNEIQLNIGKVPEVLVPMRSVQISQVLINLLNNAFDAVKGLPIKSINIEFELTTQDLFITVSDSGHGIPAKTAARIFDPFFTTKEVGQGTGLGLSISRGILLDHQGDIQLLTQEKRTAFRLRLPRHHSAPET